MRARGWQRQHVARTAAPPLPSDSIRCISDTLAGEIFNWPTFKTWEFTSENPIRSFFPLWFIYGVPMQILDWIVPGATPPRPIVTFYVLRTLFFLSSFMLGMPSARRSQCLALG